MSLRVTLIILVSCLTISACDKKTIDEPIWEKPDTKTINCGDFTSEEIPGGTLYNNVWNKQAVKGFQWRQCLEKSLTADLFGWSWEWPTDSNSIFAYPQIKVGISPWDPRPTANSGFPLENTSVRSLMVEHELEVQGNSEHNIAVSLWLTSTGDIGNKPNPSIIIAELMIWNFQTPNHMSPGGTHIGNVQEGDQNWEVWVDKHWGDVSGENSNKWVYITFRATNNNLKAKFDVIKFTDYAIEKNILPQEFYIADIELGTEIKSGSGLVWVKQFDVNVEK